MYSLEKSERGREQETECALVDENMPVYTDVYTWCKTL